MKSTYCCSCGRPRRSYEKQMPDYTADAGIIEMREHVAKVDNPQAQNEIGPQLLAHASIWRNGGTDDQHTHICRVCLAVALRMLKEIIDRDLAELEA